nr:MAG TPA: hypothetical protein [Caudoviricetes sp.]
MNAREVLESIEFKSWKEFKNYIIDTLEKKYGKRTSIHDVLKLNNIEQQLNHYAKEELMSYLIVYKSKVITLTSPNKYAVRAAAIRLEGDIRQIKEILSSSNIYAGLAGTFHILEDAYRRYELLESLLESEGDDR